MNKMSGWEEETAALCVCVCACAHARADEEEKNGRPLWIHSVCKNTMSHGQFNFLYPDLQIDRAELLSNFRGA